MDALWFAVKLLMVWNIVLTIAVLSALLKRW